MLFRRALTGLMLLLMCGFSETASADEPSQPPKEPPTVLQAEDTPSALEQPHTLVFNATIPPEIIYTKVLVELQRLGESREIALRDDGSSPGDVAYDGVYAGRDLGEQSRYVQVKLIATDPSDNTETLYAGLVRTDNRHITAISFQVGTSPQGNTAYLVASSYPGSAAKLTAGLPLLTAFGWTALLLIYIGILATRKR